MMKPGVLLLLLVPFCVLLFASSQHSPLVGTAHDTSEDDEEVNSDHHDRSHGEEIHNQPPEATDERVKDIQPIPSSNPEVVSPNHPEDSQNLRDAIQPPETASEQRLKDHSSLPKPLPTMSDNSNLEDGSDEINSETDSALESRHDDSIAADKQDDNTPIDQNAVPLPYSSAGTVQDKVTQSVSMTGTQQSTLPYPPRSTDTPLETSGGPAQGELFSKPHVTGPAAEEKTLERQSGVGERRERRVDVAPGDDITAYTLDETSVGMDKDEEPGADQYAEGISMVRKYDVNEKNRGYVLLQQAAALEYTLAKEELAYAHLFGHVLERNFSLSFELFTELAAEGIPAGQQGLGFMYSVGLGVSSNQAKALLYYTFAALGGHHFAQMTMGYRAAHGITVTYSCEGALSYYYKAAKEVAMKSSQFTGGEAINKARLLEEENEETSQYGVSEDDMLFYQNVFADSGNTGAQLMLGMFYMYGMGRTERNLKLALKFLKQAAEEGVAAANALIGRIYAEGGVDVSQDTEAALMYFRKAIEQRNSDGYCGMGMMYLYGLGVTQDYVKALEYFQASADKGSSEGQYFLGYIYLHGYGVKRDFNKALRYFQLASHAGHLVAIYTLAEMHAEGLGVRRNCNFAVELFKTVAERGRWTQMFVDAEIAFSAGDSDSALVMYLLLAEMGFEVAQSNTAFLLEQVPVALVSSNETMKRAFLQWTRSAAQGYAEARVKLGDYHYYGHGTEVNYEAAASQYRIASDKQSSAQAMFNLAFMYEHGLGLQKDYHLAKRYYDMAADTSSDAHVPVNLALFKLNFTYYYGIFYEYLHDLGILSALNHLENTVGPQWDIYLMSVLVAALLLLLLWRIRH